jgi:two-component system, cell cycle sensor histidine kinase and response regulator CckA
VGRWTNMPTLQMPWWKYGRALALPLLLWGLVILSLWEPVKVWLNGSRYNDQTILEEWIEESRGNLPGMAEEYLRLAERYAQLRDHSKSPALDWKAFADYQALVNQREKIRVQMAVLATPATKMYSSQLPLFPTIYRIEIVFDHADQDPIIWDSRLPVDASQYEEFDHRICPGARVRLRYQLHAYDKRQREEALRGARLRQLSILAIITTGLAGAWVIYAQRRAREQERQQALAQVQVNQAERLLLQEELRRQEAERRQQQAERDLLQQRLAAQEYEQKMLELKSQLYASIGIMAGSYAHNIKNLLVRPNDLLRRCLEADGLSPEQQKMLQEVRQTLGTVTERLQQILSTVRRDPHHSEMSVLDLSGVLRNLESTWKELAWDKWKIQLSLELPDYPLPVEGDLSHLQQAVENLLFNARDATFEMRNHLREQARETETDPVRRRQALIAAAGWKGSVDVRALRESEEVVLEVRDNGIGMSEEVRHRCLETHFSTKRDNAAYEGHSTGMGLGLSFVQVVLDNHRARLEIDSLPLEGTTFRIRFPAAPAEGGSEETGARQETGITIKA